MLSATETTARREPTRIWLNSLVLLAVCQRYMDPLSITASIISVLQLTDKTIKYFSDVQDAPEECQSCITEVSNLLPSLISLEDRVKRSRSNDPWVEQLRRLNVESGPFHQYKRALELLLSKVVIGDGLGKIRKQLLWKFEKGQVSSIQGRIERLKSLIAIALEMDHLVLSEAIKADTFFVRASLQHVQADVRTLQNHTQNIRDTAKSIQGDTTNIQNNAKIIQDIQIQEHYRAVREWLSSMNYPAQQQSILSRRQDGTVQWFLDSAEFDRWIRGPKKTLFCPGMPGAGKTTMAAVTIDHLSRMYGTSDVNIAYIFCNYKAEADQSVPSSLATLLKQLASNSSDAMNHLVVLYDEHSRRGTRPAPNELLKTLLACLADHTTYIIVDALDECSNEDGTRDDFIEKLLSLQAESETCLFFTSRFVPKVTVKFASHLQLEVRASEEDVRLFIDGQRSRLPGYVQRDENLMEEIQDEITKSASGMFLLARLHLDSVSTQTSPKKLRSKLKQLQKGSAALDNAYKDALTRIDEQPSERRDLAKRTLCWISYAQRQLTAQELRVALAIEPGESVLDAENLNDLDDIMSWCAGLVIVDRESAIVHLVHYTTQEYLQRVRFAWAPTMQHEIAEACLTYLSFEDFRSGSCTSEAAFQERLDQHEFLDYAARFWSHHVRPVEESVIDPAVKLLRHKGSLASVFQVVHCLYYHPFPKHDFYSGVTALHLVARVGLCDLLQHLLVCEIAENKNDINEIGLYGVRPLDYACCSGHERMAKLLLKHGAVVNAQGGRDHSALHAASNYGHERVVKLLLEHGANVNARGGRHGSALQVASARGHEQVVKLLLDHGADVNAQGPIYGSSLQVASRKGHEQVVKLLVDHGADIDAQGGRYGSALYAASGEGHRQVVKLLLEHGANVNTQHDLYGSALQVASKNGHERVVKLLFEHGANINAQGSGLYVNALQAASQDSHERVVELLFEHGADISA